MLEKLMWPAAGTGAKKLIPDYRRKWLKNLSRSILVGITALVALVREKEYVLDSACSLSS